MLIEFLNETQSDKLLKVIGNTYPEIPYNKLQSLLRKKDIRVNGKKVSDNIVVEKNDMVQLYITSLEDERKNKNINIFYSDDNILIAEKPQDLEVEGSPSLTQILSENQRYLRACHRLDRNITGLVVFAKSEKSYSELYRAFSQRTVDKFYLALVCDYLQEPQNRLDAFLFKDSKKSRVYIGDTAGKGYVPVSLEYRVMENFSDLSLVEIKLITGRTHQIRAQFAHIGHPVLGDGKYGNNEWNKRFDVKNQQLYAYKLKFNFEEQSHLAYLNDMDFANMLYLSDLREFNPEHEHGEISPLIIKNYDMGKKVDDDSFPPYEQLLAAMELAREKRAEELKKLEDVPTYNDKSQRSHKAMVTDNSGDTADNNEQPHVAVSADSARQKSSQDGRSFSKNRRRRKRKPAPLGDRQAAESAPRAQREDGGRAPSMGERKKYRGGDRQTAESTPRAQREDGGRAPSMRARKNHPSGDSNRNMVKSDKPPVNRESNNTTNKAAVGDGRNAGAPKSNRRHRPRRQSKPGGNTTTQ